MGETTRQQEQPGEITESSTSDATQLASEDVDTAAVINRIGDNDDDAPTGNVGTTAYLGGGLPAAAAEDTNLGSD